MIACVSPAEYNYEESLGTLQYASRARNIKNKPVINRDPNSMLIESLRSQIKHLQFEVSEHVILLKEAGVSVPDNIGAKFLEKQKSVEQTQKVRQVAQQNQGGANPQAVKDLKIKISHKDREIRELTQKLKDQQVFLDKKDKYIKEVEQERDNLALKSESMQEKLKANNIEFDAKKFESKPGEMPNKEFAQNMNLIDQYKAKLAKA